MSSKKILVSVYDKKVGLFDPPFAVRHIGEATREWSVVKKDPTTKFGKHPEDFDLFQIGEYDEATAHVTPTTPHLHLDTGV